ncbi:pimeloyl-ACP methyl ester carboxylesterase [Kribbella aluminosa]|uniref:Pimeloyl-ACP methyl ester carboxylesterase n=1 Tax=Kribbella aluminosa TaxID=416017 RepID=A0ABS4UPC9_9ACTN|nr:alpha/beta hydrolase [Kribbella aluminosa]MBP2353494.1 pimeloyl-ACP methyl ester carboxylesterase [Kribbella aluminosa]
MMLAVPGAELYYETAGSGPLVLLIPGGNGDAMPYAGLLRQLSDDYTVVAYNRRGFSRSPADGPVDAATRLDADADDAVALIEHLGSGPAHVFGSSSGAIVGLHLLTRSPEHVATLISHEPPLATLLPDGDEWLAFLDELYDAWRADGPAEAMRRFGERVLGVTADDSSERFAALPEEQRAELMQRMSANLNFWFEYELRTYPRYEPDLTALAALDDRLVLAGGNESRELFPYRPNTVLAERLGLQVVDFPGNHIGYATHPVEFAAQLRELLASRTRPGVRPGDRPTG